MELKDFLKKYSTISNQFIDEFLSMYKPGLTQTDPYIELYIVAKWLGMRKHDIMKVIKKHYKKGIDYTEEKSSKHKGTYGGNNYKLVLLTPDCFKRICMSSRTKKAEDVRTYYIQLEAMIIKYNEQMVEGMKDEIDRLNKKIAPKHLPAKGGYIYVIKASEKKDSVYKIGRTRNLKGRLSTYQSGKLEDIEVVFLYRTDNIEDAETCAKLFMEKHRLENYKEIYQANLDFIKKIIGGCDELGSIKEVYTLRKAPKMAGGYYVVLQEAEEVANEQAYETI